MKVRYICLCFTISLFPVDGPAQTGPSPPQPPQQLLERQALVRNAVLRKSEKTQAFFGNKIDALLTAAKVRGQLK
jgi:hypothetical protein